MHIKINSIPFYMIFSPKADKSALIQTHFLIYF